ncbi:MAG: ABC transporter ATP-binding protein [Anaerolineae bacterium]|nr:ABC transporter ATP-binding protein [Anaerolineae bacterium]
MRLSLHIPWLSRILGREGHGRLSFNTAVYRSLWGLIRPYPRALVTLSLSGLTLAGLETTGLSLIFLIMGVAGTGGAGGALGRWLPFHMLLSPSASLDARLRTAALLLVIFMLSRGVLMYLQHTVTQNLRLDVEFSLEERAHRQFHAIRLDYLLRRPVGELMTIQTQAPMVAAQLIQNVAGAIFNLSMAVIYAGMCLWLSWQMSLLATVLLSLSSFALRPLLHRRMREASHAANVAVKEMRTLVQENLDGMKVIRLLNLEDWGLARFKDRHLTYLGQMKRAYHLAGLSFPFAAVLNALGLGALLLVGIGWLSGSDEARLTQLALFLIIALRLVKPLSDTSMLQSQIIQAEPMLKLIEEFLRTDDKPYLTNGSQVFETLRDAVTLEDVSFQYDAHEPIILSHVTLRIPKGKMTAVVGPSGSGKTTLIHLITRLYDCTAGRVAVDGMDLRTLDLASWRRRVAVVSQDAFLFRVSARENLRLGRLEASEDDLVMAARQAQADGFLRALPQQYDTNVYDRGVRLSGGQQQRLALARAFVTDADLLILDEATSDLDTQTERAIQQALAEQRQASQRGLLVIAHRLSTIRDADWIYILDQGQVVQQGTHETLMQEDGLYRRLVQVQSVDVAAAKLPASGIK